MRRSKLIFFILAIIFFVILALIAYDISKKTSFPGRSKPDIEIKEHN